MAELSTLGSVIKTAYEGEANSNAFTDAEKTKLAQAILADGSVALTADWDVGAFKITGTQFVSDIITGTAPLIVASTTVVANLKAATVVTNANLTGVVTSTGNATAIADKALAIAKLADGTDGELITWDASGVITTVPAGTLGHALISGGAGAEPTFQEMKPVESLIVASGDETTDLTTGTAKPSYRIPYAFTVTEVRASVAGAPTGSTIIVDINEDGATILTTKLTIDATEKTSETATTPPAIGGAGPGLADDAEITVDIDQIGSSAAGKGLKVTLIGTRT